MVDFLERQVKILTDPVFGDIKDTPTASKDGRKSKSLPFPKTKGSTFATTVTVTDTRNNKGIIKEPRKRRIWLLL